MTASASEILDNIPLALTFLFLWLSAAARASANPPPAGGAGGAPPPELLLAATPGTAAALRSRFSWLLTRFNPEIPPLARIDASMSSFPPVAFGRGGAAIESRPGGNGGAGGPPPEGNGGGGGAPKEGNGGGGGAPVEGSGGGGGAGGPLEKIGVCGTGLGTVGNGGAEGTLRWLGKGGGSGGPEAGADALGVLGGSGGGAIEVGGTACWLDVSRDACDDGCRGVRLGGGGGAAETDRSPWKGGGTLNFGLVSGSSSMGVFGGLGGGGGPGLARFEVARCLAGRTGAAVLANFPASAIGGGALNFSVGCGGEGVRAGDSGGEFG